MGNMMLCKNGDDLAALAADRILEAAEEAVQERDLFTLALSGGSTPEKTYVLLAQPERSQRMPWKKTYLFWGDERFVPLDDSRSNYAMAQRSLLARAPIPDANVFPIRPRATVEQTATAYAEILSGFFTMPIHGAPPRFDLILLGLGDDGHTASLFPGKETLHRHDAWVVSSPPGTLPPPVDRVTLTYPVLNAAREALFLVAGEKKASAVKAILEENAPLETHPAAGVRLAQGVLDWLLDEAAASLLQQK